MSRYDIAELLAGDDFHFPDCPEYVDPGDTEFEGRDHEPVKLCNDDCLWHRIDEAAVEEIQRLRKKLVRAHRMDTYGYCACGWLAGGSGHVSLAERKLRHAAHVKRVAR